MSNVKKENNKRDITEVDKDDEKTNDSKVEEEKEDNEPAVLTTNKKIKVIDLSADEDDETSSTSPQLPKEELTVV